MKDLKKNPLANMNLVEVALGHLLTIPKKDGYRTYSQIDPRWMKTGFEKNVYKAIGQLIQKNEELDLVKLSMQFKENGWYEQGIYGKIARLTNHNDILDSRIYITSIFDQLNLNLAIEMAYQFRNSFDSLVQSGNMTIIKYNEILSKMQSIEFRKQMDDKTNEQVVLDLIANHERAKHGEITGLELPYNSLHTKILLEPVDLMVVGARPAMGKTAFAVSTACNLARQGKKVVFFALEMSREQMMRRIIANLAQVDSNAIKYGRCTSIELQKISMVSGAEFLNNIEIYEGSHMVMDIANKVSMSQNKGDVDLIIIDYLQKIIPKKSNSRYQEVTDISNGIKLLAQNFGIPVMAMAQLSRESAKTGSRPKLPDLKESGEIEQDASVVAFLHRPEYYGQTTMENGMSSQNMCEFIIAKNREGFDGIVELENYLAYSIFKDVEHKKDEF